MSFSTSKTGAGSFLPAAILLAACSTTPVDLTQQGKCAPYGVRETNTPIGPVVEARALNQYGINLACDSLTGYYDKHGCVVWDVEGVRVFWLEGDQCSEVHERCHGIHGLYHTVRYTQKVIAFEPFPACP